jgi:hypothetical protein
MQRKKGGEGRVSSFSIDADAFEGRDERYCPASLSFSSSAARLNYRTTWCTFDVRTSRRPEAYLDCIVTYAECTRDAVKISTSKRRRIDAEFAFAHNFTAVEAVEAPARNDSEFSAGNRVHEELEHRCKIVLACPLYSISVQY